MDSRKFKVNVQETETNITLSLIGELDLSMAVYFRSVINPFANQHNKALLLDLKELSYIDSTGMGILIQVLKLRNEHNAEFAVQHIPPTIKRLFDLTGLSKFLPVEQDNQMLQAEGGV